MAGRGEEREKERLGLRDSCLIGPTPNHLGIDFHPLITR